MASGVSVPPLMAPPIPAIPSNMIGIRPVMTSLMEDAAPAACTKVMSRPVRMRNSSPVRCDCPPRFEAANSMPPDVRWIRAINSAKVFGPSDGVTATAIGCTPTKPMGEKSR